MKESALLNRPGEARGFVTVEYKDPTFGKVKEKIQGENEVLSNFFVQNWQDMLYNVHMLISDWDKPRIKGIPFLLGNLIGYGEPGLGSSGSYRGAFNADLSQRRSATRNGIYYKYVYDFTPSQVLGKIGTIALSNQCISCNTYGSNQTGYVTETPIFANKVIASSATNMNYNGRFYSVSASGTIVTVLIRNPLTGVTINTTTLPSEVYYSGATYAVGVDMNTGKFYIKRYSSTVTARALFEFNDETFSDIGNTYCLTNMDSTAPTYAFLVCGNEYFVPTSDAVRVVNFKQDTAVEIITMKSNPILKAIVGGSNVGSNQYLFVNNHIIAQYEVSSGYNAWGFNCYDNKQDIFLNNTAAVTSSGFPFTVNPLNNDSIVSTVSSTTTTQWLYQNNAVTNYLLPADSPERPDGYGMTITYEIEVEY